MIWDLKSLSLFLFMHRCSPYLQENILVLIKSCWQSYILRTIPFKHETRLLSIYLLFGNIFKIFHCQHISMLTKIYSCKYGEHIFLKSAWRHSVIDYYDKARKTPYFVPWHLGDSLGVYRWPQCNYKNWFYKYHSRLSKIATGNRCRNRWTIQNVTNRNLRDPNKFGTGD